MTQGDLNLGARIPSHSLLTQLSCLHHSSAYRGSVASLCVSIYPSLGHFLSVGCGDCCCIAYSSSVHSLALSLIPPLQCTLAALLWLPALRLGRCSDWLLRCCTNVALISGCCSISDDVWGFPWTLGSCERTCASVVLTGLWGLFYPPC